MDKTLQILGLAKKAGLLAVGLRDTVEAARAGKASLVISAADASGNALRQAQISAGAARAMHVAVPYSCFDLGTMSGRGSPGTLAILDTGLAARFLEGMAETDPDRYGGPAEILEQEHRKREEKRKQTLSGKRRTAI